jgi:hypothetical protein
LHFEASAPDISCGIGVEIRARGGDLDQGVQSNDAEGPIDGGGLACAILQPLTPVNNSIIVKI